MKEKMEEIKNKILTRGRMIELDREEKIVLADYYNTISQEEQLWEQKSRVAWLNGGIRTPSSSK